MTVNEWIAYQKDRWAVYIKNIMACPLEIILRMRFVLISLLDAQTFSWYAEGMHAFIGEGAPRRWKRHTELKERGSCCRFHLVAGDSTVFLLTIYRSEMASSLHIWWRRPNGLVSPRSKYILKVQFFVGFAAIQILQIASKRSGRFSTKH